MMNIFALVLNVEKIHSYYIKNYNTAKGYQKYDKIKFLRSIAYRTEKKKIETLAKAKEIYKKITAKRGDYTFKDITLPFMDEWRKLIDRWERTGLNDEQFLRKFFQVKKTKAP